MHFNIDLRYTGDTGDTWIRTSTSCVERYHDSDRLVTHSDCHIYDQVYVHLGDTSIHLVQSHPPVIHILDVMNVYARGGCVS